MSTVPKYIPKALLRPRAKPLLIWAAPPFLAVYGLTLAAFATIAAVPTQSGSILIGDQPVSDLGYLVGIYPIVLLEALASVAAAYGLVVERLWARELLTKGAAALLMLDVVIGLVVDTPLRVLIVGSWIAWVLLALSFWFFYRYRSVRAYYVRLEKARVLDRRRDD